MLKQFQLVYKIKESNVECDRVTRNMNLVFSSMWQIMRIKSARHVHWGLTACNLFELMHSAPNMKIQWTNNVSFRTYNWIRSIILFAHDPGHAGIEADCHVSSPACVILRYTTTVILLKWTIFIFDLLKSGTKHGRTGKCIRREVQYFMSISPVCLVTLANKPMQQNRKWFNATWERIMGPPCDSNNPSDFITETIFSVNFDIAAL